ncbi:HalOD1 output domain-containing protein [Natrinema sp. HArc-T2]|uniref:HalOD1 output domain-containing protein n=1 Tax=Natrinema sp. HArc-T2 TaxID=3242701 RepID=UPI00359E8B5B
MKSPPPPTSRTDTPLSMTVVERVAEAEDADPVTLEPLYDAIDPDLLDSLPDADGFASLEFSYHGHTVRITDGNDGIAVSLVDADSSGGGSGGVAADHESST